MVRHHFWADGLSRQPKTGFQTIDGIPRSVTSRAQNMGVNHRGRRPYDRVIPVLTPPFCPCGAGAEALDSCAEPGFCQVERLEIRRGPWTVHLRVLVRFSA